MAVKDQQAETGIGVKSDGYGCPIDDVSGDVIITPEYGVDECTAGTWPTSSYFDNERQRNIGVINGNWGGHRDLEVDMVQDLQESPAQLITLQEVSWDVLRKLENHAGPPVN